MRFDAALERADVRLCFRRFLPKRLVSIQGAALDAVTPVHAAGGAHLVRLPGESGFGTEGLKVGGCLAWSVDIQKLVRAGGWRRSATRVGRDLLIRPGALLLRPALWTPRMHVTVRFVMPDGLRAAVPWPRTRDGTGYRPDRFALRLESKLAFGRFALKRLRTSAVEVDVAVLDAEHRATEAGIDTWLERAVGAVALLHGRFPARRMLVVVHPVPARSPPVLFGTAMRGGGAHVTLLLASAAKDAELPGEWVAVHEMTHLGMPWTYDTESWFQEGFATYYQEVLRARAGLITEQRAWQNFHEGFARGRRSGGERTLAAESREMHTYHTYHRVYWAGAALALLIDVELRRRFPGRWCLDDCMRLWDRMHGGTRAGAARGSALLRAADRRIGQRVCAPLVGPHLDSDAFPDLTATYTALGLRVEAGRVVLDDEAPLASVRRAIMVPRKADPSPSR